MPNPWGTAVALKWPPDAWLTPFSIHQHTTALLSQTCSQANRSSYCLGLGLLLLGF